MTLSSTCPQNLLPPSHLPLSLTGYQNHGSPATFLNTLAPNRPWQNFALTSTLTSTHPSCSLRSSSFIHRCAIHSWYWLSVHFKSHFSTFELAYSLYHSSHTISLFIVISYTVKLSIILLIYFLHCFLCPTLPCKMTFIALNVSINKPYYYYYCYYAHIAAKQIKRLVRLMVMSKYLGSHV